MEPGFFGRQWKDMGMELVHVHDKSYVIKMNGNTNAKDYGDSYRQADEFYDHRIKHSI